LHRAPLRLYPVGTRYYDGPTKRQQHDCRVPVLRGTSDNRCEASKIIGHEAPPPKRSALDLDHAAALLKEQAARREAIFKQSSEDIKIQSQLWSANLRWRSRKQGRARFEADPGHRSGLAAIQGFFPWPICAQSGNFLESLVQLLQIERLVEVIVNQACIHRELVQLKRR